MENNVEQKNSNAVVSLVLGIVSCVLSFCGVWPALVGLPCGIVAIIFAVKGRKIEAKKGMATAGLVLGIIGTVLCGILFTCGLCAIATVNSIINSYS